MAEMRAGRSIAETAAATNAVRYSAQIGGSGPSASTVNAPLVAARATCATIISRRRSTESAITPPMRGSPTSGTSSTTAISPMASGDLVSR